MQQSIPKFPTFDEMFIPTIQALENLGGSGTIEEIYEQVIKLLNLSDEILELLQENTSRTKIKYRLGWTRTYLKKYGMLENSGRGIWSLVLKGVDIHKLDRKEIIRTVRASDRINIPPIDTFDEIIESEELAWEQQLHKLLLSMDPTAFERLTQRLLRESGFIQVQVTGKAGDGGIDGVGIARINGFLSFHVLFQCKRYQSSISASQIRDFRGAMQGRTDKGLFITTGTFTRNAIEEATRDGAPPIDLIDGEQLVQRLKELQLGVKITMVESVEIDTDWFAKI
jgi:restriction system protein